MVSYFDTMKLSGKHKRILRNIFDSPIRSDIAWSDIEKLLEALGGKLSEGKGSRIRISLGGVRAVFHRPHPRKETDKGAVKSMRRFLTEAGFGEDEVEKYVEL